MASADQLAIAPTSWNRIAPSSTGSTMIAQSARFGIVLADPQHDEHERGVGEELHRVERGRGAARALSDQ